MRKLYRKQTCIQRTLSILLLVVGGGGGGCRSENKNRRPGLCLAETFPTSLQLLDRKKSLDILYQFLAFRANLTTKMAALISVWLRHFIVTLYKITTKAVYKSFKSQHAHSSCCTTFSFLYIHFLISNILYKS